MANLDTLDRNDLLKEITESAREQGVTDQEGWDELVEETIDSHLSIGELDPDQDLEGARALLKLAWEEYQNEAGQESPAAINEDPQAPNAT